MRADTSQSEVGLVLDPTAWRRALGVRGLLQQDLARRAGVAETTISGALKGRPVTATTFARLARALAAVPMVSLPEGVETMLAPSPHVSQISAARVPTLTAVEEGSRGGGDPVQR